MNVDESAYSDESISMVVVGRARKRKANHKLVRLFGNDISNGAMPNRLIDKIKHPNALLIMVSWHFRPVK